MNFELDELTLAEMTKEARQCFLDEDAPHYIITLEKETKKGYKNANFTELLRAVHSLKGGAGIAQLSSLRELAHRFEDVLVFLKKNQHSDNQKGWNLLEWTVDEITFLLHQARTHKEVFADPHLLNDLADFVITDCPPTDIISYQDSSQEKSFLELALERDLERCLAEVEQLSKQDSPSFIQEKVINFYEECLLLGETLEIPWLLDQIDPLEEIIKKVPAHYLLDIVKKLILEIRQKSKDFLANNLDRESDNETQNIEPLVETSESLSSNLEQENHQIISDSTEEVDLLSHLRIPVERLERMTNEVEELLVTREKLRLRQQQLSQVTRKIRKISRQFEPIQEQVQNFYDQLAINSVSISSDSNKEFDNLELDRYTGIHSSLQSFQELMLQFQENYADLNLINQDMSDNLDVFDSNIDELYGNVTKSRLVPFKLIAQRFLPQVQSLNRRYNKLVNFSVEGENVLIDQLLLEQLQTPLTHLINNAFDHGIESISERSIYQKSEQAKIVLTANIENHELQITVSDDGQGIDLYKVYERAKSKGFVSSKLTFDKLSQETILDWIFHTDFSTIESPSELSGRGVGLDIVRNKIQQLRGTIKVESKLHKGSKFILNIPLDLNFTSLFLVRWQHRLLAVPTSSVLETIAASELILEDTSAAHIKWRNQLIPVLKLSELLFNNTSHNTFVKSQVGIILQGSSTPFLVMVDTLISEEQLLVKPFDNTVIVPNYLLGCTILGGGEIVPVILPQAFALSSPTTSPSSSQPNRQKIIDKYGTILVAEDSVATRRLLQKILEQIGFNIIVCRDGQEALEKLELHQGGIDLVISDVEMPKVNGFELLETIRSHDNWHHIPVIMATSRTGQRHREQGIKLGANAYLGKPILPKVLLKTIQRFVNINDIKN
ncbi:MAG: response regulator [Crocosphaera sp.]|nr:response regulator [Crocosphaera sp.]